MKALNFLISLRPAIPMSTSQGCKPASNSEIRRWITDGSVTFNHERCAPDEEIDFRVHSLIFFPKSEKRRVTLL